MPNIPPLPAVLGPTENALRALLMALLAKTRIRSYLAWVVLNAANSAHTEQRGHWRGTVSKALKIQSAEVDSVLSQLHADGLVDSAGVPTDLGAAELAAARLAVASATSELVDGIDPADLATTSQVLEKVRAKAELLLQIPR